jgi:prepilin-type N-terminal cleavage/methylation domain-containing protein
MRQLTMPRVGRHNRGFTLVEIMVVVTIISILAAIAVPAIARVQRRAKTTAVLNDFRVFAAAFATYSHETGGWPAEAAAGVIPTGMNQYLNTTAWTRVTPLGGKYNWEFNQNHFGTQIKAAIAIGTATGATYTLDVNQILDLEAAIDGNSDLLGGSFRIGTGMVPLYVVEP